MKFFFIFSLNPNKVSIINQSPYNSTMSFFKFLLVLSLSIFLITLHSCSDPCDSVTCLNDGLCANGTCECPPGYTGSFCQYCPPGYSGAGCAIYDSCYNITCQNGGTCISGTCDCPPGYGGVNCETTQSPISVTINKIELTAYPTATSSGASWDSGFPGSPDVFLSINSGTTSNLFSFISGDTMTNANGSMLTYTTGFPYTLSSLASFYSLGVWDNDGFDQFGISLNDKMAGVYFQPSFSWVNPTTINLTTNQMSAKLYVTWNF